MQRKIGRSILAVLVTTAACTSANSTANTPTVPGAPGTLPLVFRYDCNWSAIVASAPFVVDGARRAARRHDG